jgi:hypothetical protein
VEGQRHEWVIINIDVLHQIISALPMVRKDKVMGNDPHRGQHAFLKEYDLVETQPRGSGDLLTVPRHLDPKAVRAEKFERWKCATPIRPPPHER